MESKHKHLEFIQNVIIRMGSNSFTIKGWTVTLVSALFALAAKDSKTDYVLISYFIIPIFWILDSYYVSLERKYRLLYKQIVAKSEAAIDFDMDISGLDSNWSSWGRSFFSKTLLLFYGISFAATLVVMFLISR